MICYCIIIYHSSSCNVAKTQAKLHEGHLRIEWCRLRARISVWWPGISEEILSRSAHTVQRRRNLAKSHSYPPHYPTIHCLKWDQIYLFSTDTLTLLPAFQEVVKLSTVTESIITAQKSIISRHGIPAWVTISHSMPHINLLILLESTTSTIAHIFHNATGLQYKLYRWWISFTIDIALLCYRATPLTQCGLSPAELVMGRPAQSSISKIAHIPQWMRRFTFKMICLEDYSSRHVIKPLLVTPKWYTGVNRMVTNNQG